MVINSSAKPINLTPGTYQDVVTGIRNNISSKTQYPYNPQSVKARIADLKILIELKLELESAKILKYRQKTYPRNPQGPMVYVNIIQTPSEGYISRYHGNHYTDLKVTIFLRNLVKN